MPKEGFIAPETGPKLAKRPTGAEAGATPAAASVPAAAPLTSVPVLNSRPGATAKLFLDFDGDYTSSWGGGFSPGTTPAYDSDGIPSSFSDGELGAIQQIWARVSEKYSPFNINVTTVDPGSYGDRVAARAVLGGDGTWFTGTGSKAGGVAWVGGFTNAASNTVYVFTQNLGNAHPKYSAEAVAHESGHVFGLDHQSLYSGTTKTDEYFPGTTAAAPIMGNSYTATRGLWWSGQSSVSSTTLQKDMDVIGSTAPGANGFGYRADDAGNTPAAAKAMSASGTTLNAAGVIEKTSDVDVYSFTAGAGGASFTAGVAATGAMLDLKLELRDAAGAVKASADSTELGESLSATLAAGQYYLFVASRGNYGDVGQYSLSGSVADPAAVNAPTGLTASSPTASRVNLAWADNSNNETGFTVQRRVDAEGTWSTLASVGANVTTFADTTAAAGTAYSYRVSAVSGPNASAFSNVASVTTVPAAPADLTATAASNTAIDLAWGDVSGESGYRVERSADGAGGWAPAGSVPAGVLAYRDASLAVDTTYFYRVVALNASGESAPSTAASARTLNQVTPAAPTGVFAESMSRSMLRVQWTDASTNETGFRVLRSTNNATWTEAGTVGAGVTYFDNAGLTRGTVYYFKVLAFNAWGNSADSNVASASPGVMAGPVPSSAAGDEGTFSSTKITNAKKRARPAAAAELLADVM